MDAFLEALAAMLSQVAPDRFRFWKLTRQAGRWRPVPDDGGPVLPVPDSAVDAVPLLMPTGEVRWFQVDRWWDARKPADRPAATNGRVPVTGCVKAGPLWHVIRFPLDVPPGQVRECVAAILDVGPRNRKARRAARMMEDNREFTWKQDIPKSQTITTQKRFNLAVETWDACEAFKDGQYPTGRVAGRQSTYKAVATAQGRTVRAVQADRELVFRLLTGEGYSDNRYTDLYPHSRFFKWRFAHDESGQPEGMKRKPTPQDKTVFAAQPELLEPSPEEHGAWYEAKKPVPDAPKWLRRVVGRVLRDKNKTGGEAADEVLQAAILTVRDSEAPYGVGVAEAGHEVSWYTDKAKAAIHVHLEYEAADHLDERQTRRDQLERDPNNREAARRLGDELKQKLPKQVSKRAAPDFSTQWDRRENSPPAGYLSKPVRKRIADENDFDYVQGSYLPLDDDEQEWAPDEPVALAANIEASADSPVPGRDRSVMLYMACDPGPFEPGAACWLDVPGQPGPAPLCQTDLFKVAGRLRPGQSWADFVRGFAGPGWFKVPKWKRMLYGIAHGWQATDCVDREIAKLRLDRHIGREVTAIAYAQQVGPGFWPVEPAGPHNPDPNSIGRAWKDRYKLEKDGKADFHDWFPGSGPPPALTCTPLVTDVVE